jgi:hypothetical protein
VGVSKGMPKPLDGAGRQEWGGESDYNLRKRPLLPTLIGVKFSPPPSG